MRFMIKKFKYTITICPATINAMENPENNSYKNNLSEKSENTKLSTDFYNHFEINNHIDFKSLKKENIDAIYKNKIGNINNKTYKNVVRKSKKNTFDNSIKCLIRSCL